MRIINRMKQAPLNIFIGVGLFALAFVGMLYGLGAFGRDADLESISAVDKMRLGYNEEVYISNDESYVGLFTTGDEDTFSYTLIPRTQFERGEIEPAYTATTEYAEDIPSQGTACVNVDSFAVKDGRIETRFSTRCENVDTPPELIIDISTYTLPRKDLPIHFGNSSLSECATYPAKSGDSKRVCAEYFLEDVPSGWGESSDISKVRFTNTNTGDEKTFIIGRYVDNYGFTNDGSFYVVIKDMYIWAVSDEYFLNKL